jgi:alkanesulfonate monooxygenase SsuD/methylene tetrahydromethanopterin reductase-like flavin-dependent oxidoreductase (luciferase family)
VTSPSPSVEQPSRGVAPRLGVSFPTPAPNRGVPVSGPELIEGAQHIEELGYAGIWMADVIGRGHFLLDPLIGLAAVAGATSRLELGTCILQVPLANPVSLARRVLTTALVAPDRFVLGVGAGSTPADFAAVGQDFQSRFTTLDQSLATMRRLWNGERVGAAQLDPWPDGLGGPPVLIGAWGGSWVERAAEEFDGWIGSGAHATWGQVERAMARFRAAGGGRAVLVSVIADLDGDGPDGPDASVNLRCPPDQARQRLERLGELGFDDVVMISANPSSDHLAALVQLGPG